MTVAFSSADVGDASPGWSDVGAGAGVPLGADAVAGDDVGLSSIGAVVLIGSTFTASVVGCEGVTSHVSLSKLMIERSYIPPGSSTFISSIPLSVFAGSFGDASSVTADTSPLLVPSSASFVWDGETGLNVVSFRCSSTCSAVAAGPTIGAGGPGCTSLLGGTATAGSSRCPVASGWVGGSGFEVSVALCSGELFWMGGS